MSLKINGVTVEVKLLWILITVIINTGYGQVEERKSCKTIYLSGDDDMAFPGDRGFYTLLNTKKNGRPTYINDLSQDNLLYLYYAKYNVDDDNGFWFVSSELNSILTGTRAPDNTSFPEDISTSWLELYRNDKGELDWKESPSVKAQCVDTGCKSGRLLVTGMMEHKHPIHVYTQGIYLVQDEINNFRPVYKHKHLDNYIYFNEELNEDNTTFSYWAISEEIGSNQAFAISAVHATDPGFIDGNWKIRNTENKFVENKLFRSKCVAETMDVCQTGLLELSMSGEPELNQLYIQAAMGSYVLQDELHNVRPVYKHTNGRYHIYYTYNEDVNNGFWAVGKILDSDVGIIVYVFDFALRPEFISNEKWHYLFPLSIADALPDFIETKGIQLKCKTSSTEEKCSDTLCNNGGTCLLMSVDDGVRNKTICHCAEEYFGEYCEEKRVCEPPVKVIPNGDLWEIEQFSNNTEFSYLSLAMYLCQPGSTLQLGDYFAVCDGKRHWQNLPTCLKEPSVTQLDNVYMSLNGTDTPSCGNSTDQCATLRYGLRRVKTTGNIYINGHHKYCGKQNIVERNLNIYGVNGGFLDCNIGHKLMTISKSIINIYNLKISGAIINLHSSNDISIYDSKLTNTLIQNYDTVSDQLKFKFVNSFWESDLVCTRNNPSLLLDLEDNIVSLCNTISTLSLTPSMNNQLNIQILNSTFIDVFINAGGRKNTRFKMEKSFVTSKDKVTRSFFNIVFLNGKSSVNITKSTFSSLKFEDFQGKESYTFAGLVIQEGGKRKEESFVDINISNNLFENNSRGLRIEISSQAKVTITNSSFVENVGYGGGGGIWVTQGKFNRVSETLGGIFEDIFGISKEGIEVDIIDCEFENNYAVNYGSVYLFVGRGGAVYVDSKSRVTIFSSKFSNNTAELLGGAVFAGQEVHCVFGNSEIISAPTNQHTFLGEGLYMQGFLFVSNITLIGLKTNDDVPLLSFIAAGKTLKSYAYIKEIKVKCPASHKVLIRNATKEFKPTLHDHVHYSCVSCPEGSYSPFGGSFWTKATTSNEDSFKYDPRFVVNYTSNNENRNTTINDIQCLSCPYGGYCKEGIHAKRNFWGYVLNDQIQFEECQPKYGCQKEVCMDYNECALYRSGTLCSDCIEGYSQTFWGNKCVPNYHCSSFWIFGLVALYGIVYILILVTEFEWKAFIHNQAQWFKKKVKHVCLKRTVSPPQSQAEEHNERGLVRMFFYYVQIGLLLKLDILYTNEDTISDKTSHLEMAFSEIINFNVAPLHKNFCIMPGWDAISKLISQAVFILYLYIISAVIYLVWLLISKSASPKLCSLAFTKKHLTESDMKKRPTTNIRFLILFIELLLFTYQATADLSLSSLDCVDIANKNVMSIKGNLECYQPWQYMMVAVVILYVGPLFLVMLLGPKALLSNTLQWPIFLISCLFPLLFAVIYPILYYRSKNNDQKKKKTGQEINTVSKAIADKITGPYQYKYGLCWEGVTTAQRLILALISTLVNDILVKHFVLSFSCLLILLLHVIVKPYKEASSNIIDIISLLFLSILSLISLVKSVLHKVGIVPYGKLQSILFALEYIEFTFLLVIPFVIVLIVVLMCVIWLLMLLISACRKRGKYPNEKKKDDPSQNSLSACQDSDNDDDDDQSNKEDDKAVNNPSEDKSVKTDNRNGKTNDLSV